MATDQTASPTTPAAPVAPRRPLLLMAVAAGLCWAGVVAMLISFGVSAERSVLAPVRVIFYLLVLVAALLTFVPMQRQLRVPGLALEGVAGAFLLMYALAFVPPPTDWLLALPEMPVYVIFIAALFYCASALALPFVYAISARVFQHRMQRYDMRRARRQAHEVGALVALCAALAGLRVLTPLYIVLVALILIVAELLLLAYIKPAA